MNYLDRTRVVIESPCASTETSTFEDHKLYLNRCLRDSIARLEAPIASHGLFAFSGAFDDAKPEERQACMEAGFCWNVKAHTCAVYADYGISVGMRHGMQLAEQMGVFIDLRYIGKNT